MLPIKDFDFISFPVAKRKQARRKRIQLEWCLYQCCQSVDRPSQIRVTAGQIHALLPINPTQHKGVKAFTTSRNNSVSKPVFTSIVAWPIRISKDSFPFACSWISTGNQCAEEWFEFSSTENFYFQYQSWCSLIWWAAHQAAPLCLLARKSVTLERQVSLNSVNCAFVMVIALPNSDSFREYDLMKNWWVIGANYLTFTFIGRLLYVSSLRDRPWHKYKELRQIR